MFAGTTLRVELEPSGIAKLVLDAQGASVNVINQAVLDELALVLDLLEASSDVTGLLVLSAKPTFVLGADINSFPEVLDQDEASVSAWLKSAHRTFSRLGKLSFPTAAAINGMALGGGFELPLSCDLRVAATDAKVGLPEVTLGLCPGWGGTVRLPRLAGLDVAMGWMVSGKPVSAEAALAAGAVDALSSPEALEATALELLTATIGNADQLAAIRARKASACTFDAASAAALRQQYARSVNPDYPAAAAIIDLLIESAGADVDAAIDAETACFARLGTGSVAKSLVGLFLSEQFLKKKTRNRGQTASAVAKGAVLGAGIMGGGIAYQSALNQVPILMKDINDQALDLGMKTAVGLLDRLISKGKMDEATKDKVIARINPQLDYYGFDTVDCVVEAVVEKLEVKHAVLAEVEKQISATSVLASNTSTISIDLLAEALERPENFCGMHFFNPVHLMQLVEVIRGSKTNENTISTTVSYAAAMGKTPIVVGDCPGFLVNRVLFPYFNGFNRLLMDGVDFERIDQVMEKFGWPMGPAYLADVIGLDTMVHADRVLQDGFPERMGHSAEPIIEALLAEGALGQKNGRGFYVYGKDANGQRTREVAPEALALISARVTSKLDLSEEQIIQRMMIPMCLEAARCVDEGIVDTAEEADLGLIMGLGFPRFRGGALRYIDHVGLESFAAQVKRHEACGPLYVMSNDFATRVKENRRFF